MELFAVVRKATRITFERFMSVKERDKAVFIEKFGILNSLFICLFLILFGTQQRTVFVRTFRCLIEIYNKNVTNLLNNLMQ